MHNTTKIAVKYRILLLREKNPRKNRASAVQADALFNIYSLLTLIAS